MRRRLWHFHGGLRLPGHKQESTSRPIKSARLPRQLIIPLGQHIGEPAEPTVSVGEAVLKGQVIARAIDYISAPVHASSSGTVIAIEDRPVPHPSGLSAPCVVIETDGRDQWTQREPLPKEFRQIDTSALRNMIREAGLVGLGGAAFPSHVKLNPGPDRRVDTLVLNGAECEPYITCDDMLMREHADQVIGGLRIMRHVLQAEHCIIGIEDNKSQAFDALCKALGGEEADGIAVARIPTIYPTGGEKQLIKVLTGEEVPSNGLPADIGVICHNVGTAAAVHAAVTSGEPLVSRLVTVTGNGVTEPHNLRVLIGTPLRDLVDQCGGYTGDVNRLIMGGPMMGFALHTDEVPVVKATNCLMVAGRGEAPEPAPAMPCIRCGDCERVCPANLLPQQLYWYARAKDFDKVQDYSLFDCIECGCCAYVCPSHIPLVQYYRFAKTEIWGQERDRQKADIARQRHEFRLERLEREKREREERLKKKRAGAKKPTEADAAKKAAIQAALERVRAKQTSTGAAPKNVDHLTEEQRSKIAEVDARRRAKAQAKEQEAESEQSEG